MLHRFILIAALLAATTATAEAGGPSGPLTGPATPGPSIASGEVKPPGDPFYPPTVRNLLPDDPYPCTISVSPDGDTVLHFENHSGNTVPAGSYVKVEYSNGEVKEYVFEDDWEPGYHQTAGVGKKGRVTCEVTIILSDDIPK